MTDLELIRLRLMYETERWFSRFFMVLFFMENIILIVVILHEKGVIK